MRRRIKGAACGHIWHIHLLLGLQGVYCWVGGVYFDHREYTAESGEYILAISGWVSVYSSTAKEICNCSREKQKTFCNGRTIFPQFSLGEPLPIPTEPPRTVFSTYCTSRAQQPKHLTKFPGYSCSYTALTWGCWTKHGWTDATASRQLATTLTDGDNNFWLAKRLIQDSTRTTVCIWRVFATTASGTERLGVLLPGRIIALWLPASENG